MGHQLDRRNGSSMLMQWLSVMTDDSMAHCQMVSAELAAPTGCRNTLEQLIKYSDDVFIFLRNDDRVYCAMGST